MQEPIPLPAWRHAFDVLHERGRIDYGIVIKWPELLDVMQLKREQMDSWAFRSEWLAFRDVCQSEDGLLITERGMNDEGFRFLSREEMADHVKTREIKKANDSLRKSVCLGRVPRDGLDDDQVKKLDHWENKVAFVGAVQKTLLRKRNLLGKPSDVVKRIAG